MQLFFLLVYIFEAIIAVIYFSENYKMKAKLYRCVLCALLLYVFGFFVNLYFHNNNIINDFAFLFINFMLSKLCFEISFGSAVFHSSFLLAIMFITELIPEAASSYLLHIPIDAYKNNMSALIIIGIISKLLYFFVCKLVSYFFSYKYRSDNENKQTFALFIYPLLTTFTLSFFLYVSVKYNFSKGLNLICVIMSTVSLLFCCFIFVYNRFIQEQQNKLFALQAMSQKEKLNKEFYSMLEQKNEEQRIFVHDIKHHLYAINSMDNTDEIKKYITKIQPSIDELSYIGKTGNKMFDLILSKYSAQFSKLNIDFLTDTRSSNLSFIEDNDLVSLISNLLDNALEAAEKSENAYVRISTASENNFVVLSAVNSACQAPVIQNRAFVSTKANKSFHGYGTKSIERVADKYDGVCQWDYDENLKEFHYNILFNKK